MVSPLEDAVPWGRSAEEYQAMFALQPEDLRGTTLDCGAGPSSFTAEMTRQGGRVIACDPLYQWTAAQIAQRIAETAPRMTALNVAHRDHFRWDVYGSPEELTGHRLRTMQVFLEDYPAGLAQHRYVVGALPSLPFEALQFDLALCSHFLFTYSEQFSMEFHLESLLELGRVAREVRVFPILTAFTGQPSPHLAPLRARLAALGYGVTVQDVPYEFQKGGNQMLCLRATRR